MRHLSNTLRFALAIAGWVCACTVAHADGLTDLKAALSRLQGQTPLKAVLEISRSSRQGEGKELEESLSKATVTLEDGARGLQVLYGKDLLARVEAEENAKEKDAKAKTPTLSAMGDIGAGELRPMILAAGSISRNKQQTG